MGFILSWAELDSTQSGPNICHAWLWSVDLFSQGRIFSGVLVVIVYLLLLFGKIFSGIILDNGLSELQDSESDSRLGVNYNELLMCWKFCRAG